MLLAAFRGRFFRHLGYVVDLLVVSACLYQELAGKGKGQSAELCYSMGMLRWFGVGSSSVIHKVHVAQGLRVILCTGYRCFLQPV